jgi:hypothetical protein
LIGTAPPAMAQLGQLETILTVWCRPPQSGRIQRAHRTHPCLPRWLPRTPPQPAHRSHIRQCHTRDARPGPCAVGQCQRQAVDRGREQARVRGCCRAEVKGGGHATSGT